MIIELRLPSRRFAARGTFFGPLADSEYKATINERNLQVDILVKMANHASFFL
jgi:hypothetical protein